MARQATGFVAALALGGFVAAGAAMADQRNPSAVLGVSSEVRDLYAPGGPVVSRDFQTWSFGSVSSERWRAGSSDFRQGGLSHAKANWSRQGGGHELVAGTSALARSDAGFNGFAQAALKVNFGLGVQLLPPNDLLAAALWWQTLLQSGCGSDTDTGGCVFNVSFMHLTKGRFAYANSSGDRQASFRESLTLSSVTPDGTSQASAQGEVRVQLKNQQTAADVRFSGDWSAGDLQPFGPAPASQLGLFAAGDARNALDDPQGPLRGWDFGHDEILTVPIKFTGEDFTLGAPLQGSIEVDLEQVATAGIGPFVYSSSTLSADFADTSTFSFLRITDPAGVVDFSQTRVELLLSPVPEPRAAWLALGGLVVLWGRRRVVSAGR